MQIKDFDFINELDLNDLDDIEKDAIESMKASAYLESFFETKKGQGYARDNYAFGAMYTQNYMLLKQLLQINMKNKELIEINNELRNQNKQIIELMLPFVDNNMLNYQLLL